VWIQSRLRRTAVTRRSVQLFVRTWDGDAAVHALHEIAKRLPTLTCPEKEHVMQWLVRDLGEAFPGIESTPGDCGGEPCIVRRRIPVWVLVQARCLGTSKADLLGSYPMLRAEDLAQVWAYTRVPRLSVHLRG
jgi:uncharacterized protein (DUF433 family)